MDSSDTIDSDPSLPDPPLRPTRRFQWFLLLFVLLAVVSVAHAANPGSAALRVFHPASVDELVETLNLEWAGVRGEATAVPNVAPARLPEGLGDLPVAVKKRTFLRSVLPLVLAVNAEIAAERAAVNELRGVAAADQLTPRQLARLKQLAARYRVSMDRAVGDAARRAVLDELALRVDTIPPSLALAQAALESGWGSSRFAVEGNSIFGQWVFSGGNGMVPRDRPDGAGHRVAQFSELRASVASYARNLNSSWAYQGFRQRRATMRSTEALDSLALAEELRLYSQRREAYVAEVQSVVRGNRLRRFDAAEILSSEVATEGAVGAPPRVALRGGGETLPPDA